MKYLICAGFALFGIAFQFIEFSTASLDDILCFSGYHHCSGTIWCCPDGYICTGSSTCLSIGAVVGIAIGCLVGIGIFIGVCYVCCCRARQQPSGGTVLQPATNTTVAYNQQQQGYGQPQYGQPQYGQPQGAYAPPSYPQKS